MAALLVIAEHRQGTIRDVTFEMLTAARALAANWSAEVETALLGDDCGALLPSLQKQSHRVIYVSSPALANYNSEAYQRALVRLVRERRPRAVLVAHSAYGADLGPSLAVELMAPLVSDVIGLHPSEDGLVATRGMYAGKLNADWLVPDEPAVLMLRQANFRPEAVDLGGELIRWDPGDIGTGLRSRFITLEEVPVTGIDITKAEVIVGVGRGIKEEKNLAPVRAFAAAMGAVLAGSRPVVDAGWLPKEAQVGSSGKVVKPKVYIALGISGAFQHVAGMKAADTIIAVNKDPKAPIFGVAHYGIVDDLHKVVPLLAQKLAEMKS